MINRQATSRSHYPHLLKQSLLLTFIILHNLSALASEAELIEAIPNLQTALENNVFNFPVKVTSSDHDEISQVEIYARFPLNFSQFRQFAKDQRQWCDALMLNELVKHCLIDKSDNSLINVYYASSVDDEIDDSFEFYYRIVQTEFSHRYLNIELFAEDGPADSGHYRINVEAVPIGSQETLLHLRYEANYGFFSRTALSIYLATIGNDKVGFSLQDGQAAASVNFIKGLRGVVERNAMRYLLALVAHNQTSADIETNLTSRLSRWHHYSTLFARQLYKMELDEYLLLKRKEFALHYELLSDENNTMPDF